MKLLSGILGLTLTSVVALASANAADIYRAPDAGGYKDGPAYVAVNWSGFYVGVNAGGAWSDLQSTDVDGNWDSAGHKFTNSTSGVFGGAQGGYNFQRGNIVFGPELDFGGIGLSHTTVERSSGSHEGASTIDSGFYLDATARLGYAIDRALVYVKGGYVYYDGSLGIIDTGVASTTPHVTKSGTSGYTIGGGVEYKLTPAWSVKGEYQYFDFGNTDITVQDSGPYSYHNTLTVNTVKVGLNYFVGNGYEPLK
jgi:outer membrane immunogenic protein